MSATGSAIVDFGAGATDAAVAVTGQAGIIATSSCEAWVDATLQAGAPGHNADEHSVIAGMVGVTCQSIVVGAGFTIHVVCNDGALTGKVNLLWVWA